MTETTIEIKKIIASEGMVLTNGEAYGKEVYLGRNDSSCNWHEITQTDYEDILKQIEAERKELIPDENIYR